MGTDGRNEPVLQNSKWAPVLGCKLKYILGTVIVFVHLASVFSLPQVYGLIYLHFCRVVREEKLYRQGTKWRIHPPNSMVWQISCAVWSEEKCEQWVKCPRVLSVKALNDVYYSTTIFAYHFKWFIQWVIWNRDTTVQYTLILSCMCFLLIW